MKNNLPAKQTDFLLYTGSDGKVNVEVFLKDETVWLTQKAMGQLFGVESHTVTYHLKEIYKSAELDKKATTRKIRAVQHEGNRQVSRELDFYNLMEEWAQFLHSFLELANYPILKDKGRVSALEAKLKAEQEYEQFRVIQDKNFISDFDKEIKRITGKKDDD